MCVVLSELRDAMRRFATSFDAALVSVADAAGVVEEASAIERMAAAVKAAAAARVADTEVWKKEGDRSAAHALARATGSSLGQASDAIETGRRLRQLPEASAAARRGELSPAQTSAIAGAATADPAAERRLLEKAARSTLSDLRDECARTRAAADPDLEARRRRIHAQRSLRDWTDPEGVWHAHCRDNPEVGAAFRAVLDPIRDEIFRQARAEGRHEPLEAYAADALAEMARRAGGAGTDATGKARGEHKDHEEHGPSPDAGVPLPTKTGAGSVAPGRRRGRPAGGGAAAKIIVRVDPEALLRGYPTDGETCEIVGFGPVAVSAIRDLIDTGDPFLAAVVTRGVEVLGFAHLGRRPTAGQQTALQWLYPRCANQACTALARLEYDHRRRLGHHPRHPVRQTRSPLRPRPRPQDPRELVVGGGPGSARLRST